jgi:hypothetical protein
LLTAVGQQPGHLGSSPDIIPFKWRFKWSVFAKALPNKPTTPHNQIANNPIDPRETLLGGRDSGVTRGNSESDTRDISGFEVDWIDRG